MQIKEDIIKLKNTYGESIFDSPKFPNILLDSSDSIRAIHNGGLILRNLYQNNIIELLNKLSTKTYPNKKRLFDDFINDFCVKTKFERQYVYIIAEALAQAKQINFSENNNIISNKSSKHSVTTRCIFLPKICNTKYIIIGCLLFALIIITFYGIGKICESRILSDLEYVHTEFQNENYTKAAINIAKLVTKYPDIFVKKELKDSLYFEFENTIIIMSQQCKSELDIHKMQVWLNELEFRDNRINGIIDNRKRSLELKNSN